KLTHPQPASRMHRARQAARRRTDAGSRTRASRYTGAPPSFRSTHASYRLPCPPAGPCCRPEPACKRSARPGDCVRRTGVDAVSRPPLQLTDTERLIFALDVPDRAQALAWIDRLGQTVQFYKIGMELLASGEYFQVLDALAARGKKVFVDLKFFDIPATVAGVVAGLGRWPVSYCTIHGWHPAMMQAAAAANRGDMRLLAVTVLTSMDGDDLRAMGIDAGPEQVVVQRALAAQAAG